MIRERLLATLSFFFGIVALALAAIGLYGRAELLGDPAASRDRDPHGAWSALRHVVRCVTTGMLAMVCLGSLIGLAGGLASARFPRDPSLRSQATDIQMLAIPFSRFWARPLWLLCLRPSVPCGSTQHGRYGVNRSERHGPT